MATYGWMINLSGKSLPVYAANGGAPSTTQIGNVTKNECFVDGTISENPWEGDGIPVVFLNSSHIMTFGLITDYDCTLVDFTDYASNGTSWVPVSTLERKVQYDTVAYYADGSKRCDLPAGSKVWLTSNGTAGQTNPNYIAVTSVETASGVRYDFDGNGFIDLAPNGRWVNVCSIVTIFLIIFIQFIYVLSYQWLHLIYY